MEEVKEVLIKHKDVLDLMDTMETMLAKLKPGFQPMTQLLYFAGEVIDKQIDSWMKLGVIEPSRSPWAASVFIVFRNSKPCMVE